MMKRPPRLVQPSPPTLQSSRQALTENSCYNDDGDGDNGDGDAGDAGDDGDDGDDGILYTVYIDDITITALFFVLCFNEDDSTLHILCPGSNLCIFACDFFTVNRNSS